MGSVGSVGSMGGSYPDMAAHFDVGVRQYRNSTRDSAAYRRVVRRPSAYSARGDGLIEGEHVPARDVCDVAGGPASVLCSGM